MNQNIVLKSKPKSVKYLGGVVPSRTLRAMGSCAWGGDTGGSEQNSDDPGNMGGAAFVLFLSLGPWQSQFFIISVKGNSLGIPQLRVIRN